MLIRVLSSSEYRHDAGRYRPFIERALQYSHRPEDTLECVEAAIDKLDAHPVVMEENDEPVAVGVVELIDTKAGRYWNIWTMAGERMDDWLDDFLGWVETVAAGSATGGSQGVMLGGRFGWSRALRKYGYEPTAVIMRKKVTP